MKLISIEIKNFRSIEDETFTLYKISGSQTFTLIGVNESGKSSFLKAISLIDDDDEVAYPKDFYNQDKENIQRCHKVSKEENKRTRLSSFLARKTSYSEVNFEVFDIPSTDYHNELYGYLEDVDKSKLDSLNESKNWKNIKTGKIEKVSLCTYIRHSIHHPENTENKKFTSNDLRKSIDILRKLKYGS